MIFKFLKNMTLFTAITFSSFSSLSHASLIEVQPISYVFDQSTDRGTYEYHDVTGNELTDGLYGADNWRLDLGSGHAEEWVGWVEKPVVNIDFTLKADDVIKLISIGSVQDSGSGIALPNISIFSRNTTQDSWSFLNQELVPYSAEIMVLIVFMTLMG